MDIFEQKDKQTKKIISKQRRNIRKIFSKRRNAVSESEVRNLDALCKLKETVNKNYPFHDQLYFPIQKPHYLHQNKEKEEQKRYTKINQYVYTIGISQ